MNFKFHRITSYTWNFQNFTCVISILVKVDIHFLGTFARWRHFTTRTRIPCVFPFIFKFGNPSEV